MKKINKNVLCIIVLLVILLLIIFTGIIVNNNNKRKEVEFAAKDMFIVAEKYYIQQLINNSKVSTIDLTKEQIGYEGLKATKGYITFDENGNASGKIYFDGYCVTYNGNNSLTSEKMKIDECHIDIPVTFPIKDGYEVYFNPVTGQACGKKDAEKNVNNYKKSNNNSITGLKEDCMKWYAFLDNEENENVNLLLDHNTTAEVWWNKTGGSKANSLYEQLTKDVENWHEEVKKTARIITATEINQIAPSLTKWDINDPGTTYYLHTGTPTPFSGKLGSNKYGWIFDNARNCSSQGCYNQDDGTWGYWTETESTDNLAWSICFSGTLYGKATKTTKEADGLRPVITVPKSIFE